ncbi:hypothetical protein [Couchioplanes azureus]|uniref:hypothetical protein n=1 Tax=Couchioplanes caeruleus TaxID=56438 RepID=UPI0016708DEF|nr:hypothetical protein [Couchioplanes caeruleus]GGQ82442.1 hypothetical protein GCM10010166_60750 [Couchioplanes caeruleus subsp. azureus]
MTGRTMTFLASVAALGVAGVVLSTTASAAEEPNTAPEGAHKLSTYRIWPGQTTVLTVLSVSDDRTPPAGITQTIDWGDGSAPQVVAGDVTEIPHSYRTAGTFTPRVILSDGVLTSQAGRQTPGYVTVSAPVGGYRVKQTSAWAGTAAGLRHHASDDTDTVRIWWGDGQSSTVEASLSEATAAHVYTKAGTFAVTAAPANEFGVATPQSAGTITVRIDATRPVVTLTKPSTPSKAASWATLRGKAGDTGTGVRAVHLTAIEKRGSSWYYYTGTTWVKATSERTAAAKAKVVTITPAASGAWSVKIKGLTKGTVRFSCTAVDRVGNRSAAKLTTQTLNA